MSYNVLLLYVELVAVWVHHIAVCSVLSQVKNINLPISYKVKKCGIIGVKQNTFIFMPSIIVTW